MVTRKYDTDCSLMCEECSGEGLVRRILAPNWLDCRDRTTSSLFIYFGVPIEVDQVGYPSTRDHEMMTIYSLSGDTGSKVRGLGGLKQEMHRVQVQRGRAECRKDYVSKFPVSFKKDVRFTDALTANGLYPPHYRLN